MKTNKMKKFDTMAEAETAAEQQRKTDPTAYATQISAGEYGVMRRAKAGAAFDKFPLAETEPAIKTGNAGQF